jgi:hypothetical protein
MDEIKSVDKATIGTKGKKDKRLLIFIDLTLGFWHSEMRLLCC